MCVKTKGDEFMQCTPRRGRSLIFQVLTDGAVRDLRAKNDAKRSLANAVPRIVTEGLTGGARDRALEVVLEGHTPG
jgi:hypothetical protein